MCRGHTLAAVKVLVAALDDGDKRIAVAAARELLDRGHGKAPLQIETSGPQSITVLHLVAARDVSQQLAALLGTEIAPQIEGTAGPVERPADISAPALE